MYILKRYNYYNRETMYQIKYMLEQLGFKVIIEWI